MKSCIEGLKAGDRVLIGIDSLGRFTISSINLALRIMEIPVTLVEPSASQDMRIHIEPIRCGGIIYADVLPQEIRGIIKSGNFSP